jgi:predicted aspartyl protease
MTDSDANASLARPVRVFYSYSHKDEKLRDKLAAHLDILKRNGIISAWHDRRISAGTGWTGEIDDHLNRADIILLLISAEFIASDYCYDKEMTRAMERHETGEARVIPVILRPCDWAGAPFGKLQGLPKDMKPVTSWTSRDEAFKGVAVGIRKAAQELQRNQPEPPPVNDSGREPTRVPPAATVQPRPLKARTKAHRLKWRPDPGTLLRQGAHIEIVISRAAPELKEGHAEGIGFRALPVRALIDTGASLTLINPQIADTCELIQTDWTRITTVGGMAGSYPAYAAAISFPGTNLPRFEVIRVVACPIINQPFFSCLIGRDILRKWLLIYDGPNGQLEIRS